MRKRTPAAILAAILCSGLLAACGSSDEGSGGASGGGEGGDKTLKIGYAAALSGVLAPYDTPFHNALKVALDEKNAAGGLAGYKVELTVKDAKSEIPVAAQVSQELVDSGIDVLITPCDADPSVAAGQAAQTAKIPAISGCAGSAQLPGAVGDFMFQNVFAVNSQVVPLAQYAYEDKGYKTAALLYSPDTRYTNDGPVQFGQVFEKLGGKIATKQSYKFGSQDFGAQITKIKGARPDVIMTSAYGADLTTFLKQLRGAGVDAPVLGTDGADAPSLLTGAKDAAEGMVFTTHGMPVDEEPKVKEFAALYKEKTGKDPESAFVYAGPDLVATLEAAVEKAGSLDGQKLRDALDSLSGVQGTTGEITYEGMNRSPLKAVTLVEVKDGKFGFLDQRIPDRELIPPPIKGE
jgi:branched-chain amino acid transport system substrate-binding protein